VQARIRDPGLQRIQHAFQRFRKRQKQNSSKTGDLANTQNCKRDGEAQNAGTRLGFTISQVAPEEV
jgi:hypothetical protein